MSSVVFNFKDFRRYLLEYFGDKKERTGLKSKAARFLGCHTTMVSQILHGQVTPSLEQAEKLSQFIGHSNEEAHYFLLMIQKTRAGTKSLESYFQNQIEHILKSRQVIKNRVGTVDSITEEDEAKYYSSWQFAAVHVALSVSKDSLPENISATLNIPIAQVRQILEFLIRTGLANAKEKGYSVGAKHIHLGAESRHIKNHHMNWRMRAIQSIDNETKNNFHYSSAVTLSTQDIDTIKELLIQNLKSANKIIQNSKEEEIYGLNFDFYNLKF